MGKKNDVKRNQKVNIEDIGITLIIGMFLLAFSVMLYVAVLERQSNHQEDYLAESVAESEKVEADAVVVGPEETLHMEETLILRAEETMQQAQSQNVIDESKEPVTSSTDNDSNSNRDSKTPTLDESAISNETTDTTSNQNSGNGEMDSNWNDLTKKKNDPEIVIRNTIEDSTIKLTEDTATVTERWYRHLNGGIYTGSVKDDLPDGSGKLVWEEGIYEGSFVGGYPKGSGTFHFASDSMQSVSGTWSYGKIAMVYSEGPYKGDKSGTYTGLLFEGRPWGYGFWDFGNSSYSGSFMDGYPAGEGTYVYADSIKSSSEYAWISNLKLNLITPKQNLNLYYTGMTKNGQPHGYGEMSFEKGGTFYGEFSNGNIEGEGIYVYSADLQMILASKENSLSYGTDELRRIYGSEKLSCLYGSNWKVVTAHRHSLNPGYIYYGLTLDGDWQGYGLGVTPSNNYYLGEVVDCSRNGYGRLYLFIL